MENTLRSQKRTQFSQFITALISVGCLYHEAVLAMHVMSSNPVEEFVFKTATVSEPIEKEAIAEARRKAGDADAVAVTSMHTRATIHGGKIVRGKFVPFETDDLITICYLVCRDILKTKDPVIHGNASMECIDKYTEALFIIKMNLPKKYARELVY
ncbi:MAG: hypothetical protein V4478_03465 [Patescibacteria group bacterium]